MSDTFTPPPGGENFESETSGTQGPTPDPVGLSRDEIHSIAKAFAERIEYEPGMDPRDVITRIGGRVVYRDIWNLDNDDHFSMTVQEENSFTIFLALSASREAQNFTIAHELGHYVLHYLVPQNVSGEKFEDFFTWRYGTGTSEWEANRFATAFLLPEDEFSRRFAELKADIKKLAKEFGVTKSMATNRAEGLGLLASNSELAT